MCGIIGFAGSNLTDGVRSFLSALLKQSQIRGMHAYGVAYGYFGDSLCFKKTFDLNEIVNIIYSEQYNMLMAHTRYSTSGDWRVLANNQPISVGKDVLVFNGVVRMCSKNEYQKEFKEHYQTENDGEIVLRLMQKGKPYGLLLRSYDVSYAGLHYIKRQLFAMRNENRPLWLARHGGNTYVASTKDIFTRSFVSGKINCQLIPAYRKVLLCA